MSKVTLIGERLAETGAEFVYGGESEACAGCPYRGQCLNLTEGRRYRVTGIRDSGTLECAVHASGVTAVEVEPAPVLANVSSNAAYAGSKVTLEGPCPAARALHAGSGPDARRVRARERIVARPCPSRPQRGPLSARADPSPVGVTVDSPSSRPTSDPT